MLDWGSPIWSLCWSCTEPSKTVKSDAWGKLRAADLLAGCRWRCLSLKCQRLLSEAYGDSPLYIAMLQYKAPYLHSSSTAPATTKAGVAEVGKSFM